MKKKFVFFLVLVFALLLVGCSGETASNDNGSSDGSNQSSNSGESENNNEQDKKEVIKARLAHNMPVEHHISKGAEKFAELMEEKTNGQVKITVYPSGQLYDDQSGIEAIRNGSLELFTNTLSKWGGDVPTGEIFSLPGLFTDAELTYKIMEEGLEEMLVEDFRKVGAENLFLADYGSSYLSSLDEPYLKADSFDGKKIRVTNVSAGEFVQAMNAAPASMSGSEVPQALARGTIDGAFSGVTSFNSRKYDDYSKNFTGPFYVAPYFFGANKEWFDNLPDDIKATMREVSDEVNQYIRDLRAEAENKAIKELGSRGMEYVEANKEVKAEWLKASERSVNKWLERAGERGKEEIDFVYKYLK
jgi:TRAP-type C4-dicarboxylate transport system substrate-binding protein